VNRVSRKVRKQPLPASSYEEAFWECGCQNVAGVDEVGRGALAGPLVAAAVILTQRAVRADDEGRRLLDAVRDSKCLTATQREDCAKLILDHSIAISVGSVTPLEIDQFGLSAANRIAMERAVTGLRIEADAMILDAYTTDLGIPQVGVVRGDAISLSVAAASIIAKVTRDRHMTELEWEDHRFTYSRHKGYGTVSHLKELEIHGPSWVHRRCFAPVATLST
jgi:ribonuclease HII